MKRLELMRRFGVLVAGIALAGYAEAEITWSILHPVEFDVGYVRRVLDKAQAYGGVDSIEIASLEMLGVNRLLTFEAYPHAAAGVDRADVAKARQALNEICALAHAAGKKVYFWHREVTIPKGILEDCPQLRDADGEFDLLGKPFHDFVRAKVGATFEAVPGLDGIVLTLAESDYSVLHNSRPDRYPPAKVVAALARIYAEEHEKRGKRFILRSNGDREDYAHILNGAREAANGHDIEIETKVTEGDFMPWLPRNPYLVATPPTTLGAECDALGEFLGAGDLPAAHVGKIKEYVDSSREAKAARYAIRIDRRGFSIFDSAHEVNLYAYMRFIQDPSATPAQVMDEFARRRFGKAAPAMTKILESELELVRDCLYTASNLTFHIYPALPVAPFKFVKAGGVFGLYRDGADLSNLQDIWSILYWHKAPGRRQILNEKDTSVRLAEDALRQIERYRGDMPAEEYARQHQAFARAVDVTRAVRTFTRCAVAYFDDMEARCDEPTRLAEAFVEAEKLRGFDVLTDYCRQLVAEYPVERKMRKRFERAEVCDFVIAGGIYDDNRVRRFMMAAFPELKGGRVVRHVGNPVWPNGTITVKLRAPEQAAIEIALDPSDTQECAVSKSWKDGVWTVTVGKKGAAYPSVESIAAVLPKASR